MDVAITASGGVGPHGEAFAWGQYEGEDVLVSLVRNLTLEFVAGGSGVAVYGTPPTTTVFAWAPRP
jgi:hypothetical protein